MSKKIVIANWKMNGTPEFMEKFFNIFYQNQSEIFSKIDTVFSIPFPLIPLFENYSKNNVKLGAQDCGYNNSGAYTGDTSPELLKTLNTNYVILGHSERRQYYRESNELVRKKFIAAQNNNLIPIVCVGESLQERENNIYIDIISEQLLNSIPENSKNFIIAYEPVWAIGTGKVPTNDEIAEVFSVIRKVIKNSEIRIVYGGSVNAGNCDKLNNIKDLSGYLVGSASLKANDFFAIIKSMI